jgi:hypothetical protein
MEPLVPAVEFSITPRGGDPTTHLPRLQHELPGVPAL